MSSDLVTDLENKLYDLLPLVKALNCRVDDARTRYVKMSMSRSPIVVNHFGAFHAGALFTFAETVGGAIAEVSFDWDDTNLINKRGEITFRKLVTEKAVSEASFAMEDVERIRAEIDEKGKTVFTYTVIVKNQDDEVACEVTFDFYMRKKS